jgi:hypothetical protein
MNKIELPLKSKKILLILFTALVNLISSPLKAQTNETSFHFKATADLVSQYVWRGSLAPSSPTPNFQPTLALTKGKFEIGVWGSTDFTGSYKELDPYLFFTPGHFKLGVTDYNWNFSKANYFNYKNSITGHRIEGTIGFSGTEKIPVSVTWNTMFYGFDKSPGDSTRQAFSTYIELAYSKGPVSLFIGFTPWPGYYNNYGVTAFDSESGKKSFSVVNVGASVSKSLKITETFSLPLKATLVINPSATYSRNDYIHLIFGITF